MNESATTPRSTDPPSPEHMVNTAVSVDRGVRIRAGGGDCPLVSANRTKINNEHLSASKKVQPLEQVDKCNYVKNVDEINGGNPPIRVGVACSGLLTETTFDDLSDAHDKLNIKIVFFIENNLVLHEHAKQKRPGVLS